MTAPSKTIAPKARIVSSTTQRIAYYEGVRGLAIIAVVAIHGSGDGIAFVANGLSDPNFLFTLGLKQALVFAVPVFFFLSGYFSSTSIGPRLLRVGIPYLIWSVAASVLLGARDPGIILGKILTGSAVGPYYFMLDLLVLIALTPLIARALCHPAGLHICLGIGLTHVLFCYVALAVDPELNWWWYMISPTAWLPYYALGMARKLRVPAPSAARAQALGALALAGLALSCLEGFVLLAHFGGGGGALQPVKLSSMLYALAVCDLVLALRGQVKFPRWLCRIGSVSFGIYLLHELVRSRIASPLREIPILYNAQPLFQGLVVTLTIIACVIVIALSRRALGGLSQRILGL